MLIEASPAMSWLKAHMYMILRDSCQDGYMENVFKKN